MAMGVWGSVSIGLAWILTGSTEEAVYLQTPLLLPPLAGPCSREEH